VVRTLRPRRVLGGVTTICHESDTHLQLVRTAHCPLGAKTHYIFDLGPLRQLIKVILATKTPEIKIPCKQFNDYLHCEAVDLRGFDGWNGQTRHITISVKVNTSITLTVVVDHSLATQLLEFATWQIEGSTHHETTILEALRIVCFALGYTSEVRLFRELVSFEQTFSYKVFDAVN
jgi:hypothetical protein